MVSGIGGTKPSSLSPFLFYLYKTAECLDAEKERYYKATRVEEAYGFNDSDEELEQEGSEGSGAAGAGLSEPAPPA